MTDPRMTYDNTLIEIDVVEQGFGLITSEIIRRGDNNVAVLSERIIYRDLKAYITLRTALAIGLVTEFDFQQMT